jgi:hypothetical protein
VDKAGKYTFTRSAEKVYHQWRRHARTCTGKEATVCQTIEHRRWKNDTSVRSTLGADIVAPGSRLNHPALQPVLHLSPPSPYLFVLSYVPTNKQGQSPWLLLGQQLCSRDWSAIASIVLSKASTVSEPSLLLLLAIPFRAYDPKDIFAYYKYTSRSMWLSIYQSVKGAAVSALPI